MSLFEDLCGACFDEERKKPKKRDARRKPESVQHSDSSESDDEKPFVPVKLFEVPIYEGWCQVSFEADRSGWKRSYAVLNSKGSIRFFADMERKAKLKSGSLDKFQLTAVDDDQVPKPSRELACKLETEEISKGHCLTLTPNDQEFYLHILLDDQASCGEWEKRISNLPWMSNEDIYGSANVVYQGMLWKEGHVVKSWTERQFVLYTNGHLCYYDDEAECKGTFALANLSNLNLVVTITKGKRNQFGYTFLIKSDFYHLICAAKTERERDAWVAKCLSLPDLLLERRTKAHSNFGKRLNKLVRDDKGSWVHKGPQPDEHGNILTGWLTKKGQNRKNWKRRYFALKPGPVLHYYTTPEMRVEKGCVPLSLDTQPHVSYCNITIEADVSEKGFPFEITTHDRELKVLADSAKVRQMWILNILALLERVCNCQECVDYIRVVRKLL